MPLKDDFLTRITERLEQTLAEVAHLTERGRADEALSKLNATYRETTGSDAQMVHRLSTNDLLSLLSTTGTLEVEKALLMAELLHAESRVHASQDREVSALTRLKMLELYLHALLVETGLIPHYQHQVAQLVAALDGLPLETERRLFEYDAHSGDFAAAEDRLFEMLEAHPGDAELARWGAAHYEGWLELPDDVLEAGNLPKDEVRESLASLRAVQGEALRV